MLIVGRGRHGQSALEGCASHIDATFEKFEKPQMAENPRQANRVMAFAQNCVALLEKRTRFQIAALDELLATQTVENGGERATIIQIARDRDASLEQ